MTPCFPCMSFLSQSHRQDRWRPASLYSWIFVLLTFEGCIHSTLPRDGELCHSHWSDWGDHWLMSGLRGVSSDLLPTLLELSWCWQSLATSYMGVLRASVRSTLYPANDTSIVLCSASDSGLGVCFLNGWMSWIFYIWPSYSQGWSTLVAETHKVSEETSGAERG